MHSISVVKTFSHPRLRASPCLNLPNKKGTYSTNPKRDTLSNNSIIFNQNLSGLRADIQSTSYRNGNTRHRRYYQYGVVDATKTATSAFFLAINLGRRNWQVVKILSLLVCSVAETSPQQIYCRTLRAPRKQPNDISSTSTTLFALRRKRSGKLIPFSAKIENISNFRLFFLFAEMAERKYDVLLSFSTGLPNLQPRQPPKKIQSVYQQILPSNKKNRRRVCRPPPLPKKMGKNSFPSRISCKAFIFFIYIYIWITWDLFAGKIISFLQSCSRGDAYKICYSSTFNFLFPFIPF